MNIAFLERYNNYANRIVITKEKTLESFQKTQADNDRSIWTITNANFNPNDGIETKFVYGSTTESNAPDWIPDYAIVYDPEDAIRDPNALPRPPFKYIHPISSCWFVTEAKRLRGGQYELSLHRDVVRDNYDSLLNADIYVDRGTVNDTDSFIFNSEGTKLNQIKQSEILLKDPTNCQWLVGYCVQDYVDHSNLEATYTQPASGSVISWTSIPSSIRSYIDLSAGQDGKNTEFLADYENSVEWKYGFNVVKQIWTAFVSVDNYAYLELSNNGWTSQGTGVDTGEWESVARMGYGEFMNYDINNWPCWDSITYIQEQLDANKQYILRQFRTELSLNDYANYMILLSYNGKTIYNAATGKYYKINVAIQSTEDIEKMYQYSSVSNVRYRFRQYLIEAETRSASGDLQEGFQANQSTTSTGNFFRLSSKKIVVNVTAEEQGSNTVHWTIPARRKHLFKEPYDMFCIPYGTFRTKDFTVSKEACMAACRAAALSGIGSSNALVYDIQLLPYCPLPSMIRGPSFNESVLTEHEDYEYIYGPQNVKLGIVYWCTDSEFTFDIPCRINVNNVKEEAECDLYRLCSPNYAGIFEFNLAKNNGLRYFNVDCSYRPFEPYIHINPNFGGLYGDDFNDSRGLLCGGDWSLAIATSAWEQYKLQNKNYQAIFDRGIQRMDDKFAVDMTTGVIKAVNKAAVAGASAAESIVGGLGVGAIVSGVTKTAGSLINSAADLTNLGISHARERQYQSDMFQLQNGTIQALPNSLSKTDPFTYNNKKWPFLEKYTCTDEEKEAFRNNLKFNGMTVGRIGKINEFTVPDELSFFQGKLIRDNLIIEDSHMVDAIYDELSKGVYL